jgi:hypothetical protein
MVITYRTIGQHIVKYEQWGAQRAEYGSGLLQKLADDLTQKFGRGFSRQNLQNMKQFYILYPNCQTLSSKYFLSWSHYIFLIRLEENERKFYEIESVKNNRSLRELKRQFDSWLYLRLEKNALRKCSRFFMINHYKKIFFTHWFYYGKSYISDTIGTMNHINGRSRYE